MRIIRQSTPLWKNRYLGSLVLAAALALGSHLGSAQAQPATPPAPPKPDAAASGLPPANGATSLGAPDSPLPASCDEAPACPCVCDPVGNVPNFFGDFVARGLQARRLIPGVPFTTTTPLQFSGTGSIPPDAIPALPTTFFHPFTPPGGPANAGIGGPGGPYPITTNVTGTFVTPTNVTLNQNAQLTNMIRGNFPTATFENGTGNLLTRFVLFNYQFTTLHTPPDQLFVVNLPDPSGGGLVGRNNFFDNGSPVPHDRVYFFYNDVGDFRGLGTGFNVNRYVFGVEKAFLCDRLSLEVRVPFAGTANSDQTAGQGLSVDNTEFGDLGLALKVALLRTPNFLVSAGLGLSLPTADDSRMFLNGQQDIVIQNHATLLQPLVGVAWAPNDRFYSQLGWQLNFDPSGNPVLARDVTNSLIRDGVLRDQDYSFLSAAAGYWVYRHDCGWLTGLALQGELHYDRSFGPQHAVQGGNVLVTDLTSRINVLNATGGVIMNVGKRASLSVGASAPLTGDRLYDWNFIAQLNYRY